MIVSKIRKPHGRYHIVSIKVRKVNYCDCFLMFFYTKDMEATIIKSVLFKNDMTLNYI